MTKGPEAIDTMRDFFAGQLVRDMYPEVVAEYSEVFDSISQVVNPYIERYLNHDVPFAMLRGAALNFDIHNQKWLSVCLGCFESQETIDGYFLTFDHGRRSVVAGLDPLILNYLPEQFKKYHGQKSIDNARIIATELANPYLNIRGLELRKLNEYNDRQPEVAVEQSAKQGVFARLLDRT